MFCTNVSILLHIIIMTRVVPVRIDSFRNERNENDTVFKTTDGDYDV